MTSPAAAPAPHFSFSYRRGRGGFEVWLWRPSSGGGACGLNLSGAEGGAGYPATLELARAWARRNAFRFGVVFAEAPPRKREPKPPPLTDEQREHQRIQFLTSRAQDLYDTDPAHAAELWVMCARAVARLAVGDLAHRNALAAAQRAKNAITCLEKWRTALLATPKPRRRLALVPPVPDAEVSGAPPEVPTP